MGQSRTILGMTLEPWAYTGVWTSACPRMLPCHVSLGGRGFHHGLPAVRWYTRSTISSGTDRGRPTGRCGITTGWGLFLGQAIMQAAGGNSWALNARGPGVRETTELGKRATGITAHLQVQRRTMDPVDGLGAKRHMPATLRALGLGPEDVFGASTKASKAIDWVHIERYAHGEQDI